jgi:hypothetical protein
VQMSFLAHRCLRRMTWDRLDSFVPERSKRVCSLRWRVFRKTQSLRATINTQAQGACYSCSLCRQEDPETGDGLYVA